MSIRFLLLNQLLYLKELGYDVMAVCSDGEWVPEIEQAGIAVKTVNMTRRFTPRLDFMALFELVSFFRHAAFTIVHTHTPKAGLLGRWAAKLAGVPIVINTVHGFYFNGIRNSLYRKTWVLLERAAGLCSDSLLSQSSEDVQVAIREGICPPGKISNLGNGIDVRRFDRNGLNPNHLEQKRQEVGLPRNARVVGFVGRLVREKGLLELFAAMRLVRDRVPALSLLIVGPTETQKADALSPETARAYGVSDISTFLGTRQDMPELYALMDVLVLPSHREGFPRAPMEASAMEVPCVVTDILGCREVVEHDRNGLRVPLGNVEALAGAITELLSDQERAQSMGEEGRRMARERFDERIVFERIKREYERLLRLKGLPIPVPPTVSVRART